MTDASQPRVTVVVATLGRSPVLAQALAAIDKQRQRVDLELVVVTQGSIAEDTLKLILNSADRHLTQPHPVGFAAANNLALRGALEAIDPSPFVALVNDDAIVDHGWLLALIESLQPRPDVASAQGINLQPAPDHGDQLVDGTGIAWNRSKQAVQIGHGEPAHLLSQDRNMQACFGVSATAAVFRLDALRATLGPNRSVFDEALDTYYEDVDLACRLREAGWSAHCVPAATCVHVGSSSAPVSRQRLLISNRHLVLARHLGRSYLLTVPLLALRDVADFGWQAAIGWGRTLRMLPRYLNLSRALPLSNGTNS